MSLDQLKAVVVVAEEGSVSRAARRLHISQPPLSRQIASLEDELGTTLFARGARGMVLNDDGAVFVVHARRVLDAVDAARAALFRRGGPARPR
jgi:DNA-binding transcriptional LysR family regulator